MKRQWKHHLGDKKTKCIWAKKSFVWINTHIAARDCGKAIFPISISNSLADISPLPYLPQAQPSLRAVSNPPASFALVSQPWKLYFFWPPLKLQKQVKFKSRGQPPPMFALLPWGLARGSQHTQEVILVLVTGARCTSVPNSQSLPMLYGAEAARDPGLPWVWAPWSPGHALPR